MSPRDVPRTVEVATTMIHMFEARGCVCGTFRGRDAEDELHGRTRAGPAHATARLEHPSNGETSSGMSAA